MTAGSGLAMIRDEIAVLKARLDALRPLKPGALEAVRKHFDVELTYTSNAIEGNTLTLRETAEVIEHGLTIGGKPLRDHLEAADHYAAIQWVREIASGQGPVGETLICELHRRIVLRSNPSIAGVYSQHPRRIAGSAAIFPAPAKIPDLMKSFGAWLQEQPPDPDAAIQAHLRLVNIHPFGDGNGRTARLLMNLIFLRAGYPPVAIRPEDRIAYLDALESNSLSNDHHAFDLLMLDRLKTTLTAYLAILAEP
jgi:Fic family protein